MPADTLTVPSILARRYFDRRVAASDDLLALLHARQAALRRFAEAVLEAGGEEGHRGQGQHGHGGGGGSGGAIGEGWREAARFKEWFQEQMELQVGDE